MLELVPPGLQIDFIGKAKIWISISVVVILIGIASIVWRGGVNQGIDFSGGTLLQLRFSQPADLSMVREALGTLGLYAILGTGVYISGRFEAKWFVALGLAAGLFVATYTIPLESFGLSPLVVLVGALVAFVVLGLLLQLFYALAAIVAIYHDVLVTVGFLSLFGEEFDLQIIAALLTIIGYSLNDTIVIFDRIRENMRGQRRAQFSAVVNASVNQTLSRTLLTTGYTLLVVIALLLLGGDVLHGFAFALLVGMIAGTYSTVFIASPLLVYCHAWTASRAGRTPGGTVDARQT